MAWYWWLLIGSGILVVFLACTVSWVRELLGLVFNVLWLIVELFG